MRIQASRKLQSNTILRSRDTIITDRRSRQGDSHHNMEFQDTFQWEVLDNNQPVLPPVDDGGTIEDKWNWRTISEEPVISKRWLELTSECAEEIGCYQVHVRGNLERFNPLRYKAQFDGGNLFLFEEGEGINLLLSKAFTRSNTLYILDHMRLKLGPDYWPSVLERQYRVGRHQQDEVQHEYLENSINIDTEIRFCVDISFRAS